MLREAGGINALAAVAGKVAGGGPGITRPDALAAEAAVDALRLLLAAGAPAHGSSAVSKTATEVRYAYLQRQAGIHRRTHTSQMVTTHRCESTRCARKMIEGISLRSSSARWWLLQLGSRRYIWSSPVLSLAHVWPSNAVADNMPLIASVFICSQTCGCTLR
jgi:hypothetical protein